MSLGDSPTTGPSLADSPPSTPVPYQPRWRGKSRNEWLKLGALVLVPYLAGALMLTGRRPEMSAVLTACQVSTIVMACVLVLLLWVETAGVLSKMADPAFREAMCLTGRTPREVLRGEVSARLGLFWWGVGALTVSQLSLAVVELFIKPSAFGEDLIGVLATGLTPVVLLAFAARVVMAQRATSMLSSILGIGIVQVLMAFVLVYVVGIAAGVCLMGSLYLLAEGVRWELVASFLGLPLSSLTNSRWFPVALSVVACGVAVLSFVPGIELSLQAIEGRYFAFEKTTPPPPPAPPTPDCDRHDQRCLRLLGVATVMLGAVFWWLSGFMKDDHDFIVIGYGSLLCQSAVLMMLPALIWAIHLGRQSRRRSSPGAALAMSLLYASPWLLGVAAFVAWPLVIQFGDLVQEAKGSRLSVRLSQNFSFWVGWLATTTVIALLMMARVAFVVARGLRAPRRYHGGLWATCVVSCELSWVALLCTPLGFVAIMLPVLTAARLSQPSQLAVQSWMGLDDVTMVLAASITTGVVMGAVAATILALCLWRWWSVMAARDRSMPTTPTEATVDAAPSAPNAGAILAG